MTDLWTEASLDHEAMAREAALARADAELVDGVMPFLLAARTPREFEHRAALAYGSISSIAADNGIDEADLMATAARRWELYRQALQEGVDPVAEVAGLSDGSGFGSGPAKGYEHDEGPDWSGGYSEVPCGPTEGPDPAVTRPRPPMAGPVQEAAGSLRATAAENPTPGSAMMPAYTPLDNGTTPGVDTGLPSASTGGMSPNLPAGVSSNGDNTTPITPPSIGQVTSTRDPVRQRVLTVTAAIADTNPHLPQHECERVARVVVGRYLKHADLNSSVMDNQPVDDSGSQDSGSGGHNGMSGLAEYGLGRALIKAAPDMIAAL